jgi:dedicated sortase system histidine kinase
MQIDGRRDDWRLDLVPGLALDDAHTLWAGVHERFAYLFIEVADEDLVYQAAPGATPHGDRVVLLVRPEGTAPRWLLLLTAAQGAFRAQTTVPGTFAPTGRYEDRVVGAWQETSRGFAVETRIPLGLVEAGLGVAIVDVDTVGSDGDASSGAFSVPTVVATWNTSGTDSGAFVYRRPTLERMLAQFTRSGDRVRVLNRAGWVLADTGGIAPVPEQFEAGRSSLAERFFRYALRREDPPYAVLEEPTGRLSDPALRAALEGPPAVAWYRDGPDNNAIVAAAVPIRGRDGVLGAVLLEQASDPILTLTNQALLRLMTYAVLASVIAAIGLVGYASFLSFRVRRLASAAETALGPKGEINVVLPGSRARDEIGDLARSFTDLLRRLREYTTYLRTLTGKLTHELRTPLAIVSTSLDNLEHEIGRTSAEPYLRRLRDGAERLDSLIVAMSAATRMEQAIDGAAIEEFDLGAVIRACSTAYGDVYPEQKFLATIPPEACPVSGSSELVAQLLDKLVENAASFSPAGSVIRIKLIETPADFALSVENAGPPLPASMRHQLFDSLVSVRAHNDGRAHLGLGLYIVSLIATFHCARVDADNLSDGSGVVFSVRFPRT